MPDEPAKRPFVPSRSYDLEMIIRDKDYSNDLTRVRIVNTLDNPFTQFILDMFVDARDIVLDHIYGQDPIKLKIRYIGQTQPEVPKEQVEYDLIHFKSGFPLPLQKSSSQVDQPDRTQISIVAIAEKDMFSLSTLVNKVYYAATIQEIVTDLASEAYTELEIDTEDLNTEKLDQVIIPPISLNRAIQYLDNTFGFYKGTMGWTFKDGKVKIYNLTRRMNKADTFIIYQLVSGDDNSDIVEKCNDGKRFYTYELIRSDYGGNVRFTNEGKLINHIVKPRDTLFGTINLDLENVCKSYGLLSKRDARIFFNPKLNRTRYHVDHTGYDTDDTFAISRVAPPVRNMAAIRFTLERNLRILNLVNVGQPVQLTVNIMENKDLSGKYILRSTDLHFNRSGEWQAVATVRLMRTHQAL